MAPLSEGTSMVSPQSRHRKRSAPQEIHAAEPLSPSKRIKKECLTTIDISRSSTAHIRSVDPNHATAAEPDTFKNILLHSDLKNKSLQDLQSLLQMNEYYKKKTRRQNVIDVDALEPRFDAMTLDLVEDLVETRIKAIRAAIVAAGGTLPTGSNSRRVPARTRDSSLSTFSLHRSRPRTFASTPIRQQASASDDRNPAHNVDTGAPSGCVADPSASARPSLAPQSMRKVPSMVDMDEEDEVEAQDEENDDEEDEIIDMTPIHGTSSFASRRRTPRTTQAAPIIIDDSEEDNVGAQGDKGGGGGNDDDQEDRDSEADLWMTVDGDAFRADQTPVETPVLPIRGPSSQPTPPPGQKTPAVELQNMTFLQADSTADRDCYDSVYYTELMENLKSVFKLKDFRINQLKAITATLSGQDVFVLMPTGAGKSLCYQLPAICKMGVTKGVTFVISPLLALMYDQVWALKKLGVKAAELHSDQTPAEQKQAVLSLTEPSHRPDIVYLTPEAVDRNVVLKHILRDLHNQGQLARFVVDEAHLISSWGRDFRMPYQRLGRLRQEYPDVPIMALTATASARCVEEVVQGLGMRDCILLKTSFNRHNLVYEVQHQTCMDSKVVETIAERIITRYRQQTGIIYCHTRHRCEEVTTQLRSHGIEADYFHAVMAKEEKNAVYERWRENKVQVIIATVAFGMGIDKSDVRFVIHMYIPKTLEEYYQQTGRAGRDGKHAECLMFWQVSQLTFRMNKIDISQFPEEEKIRAKDGVDQVAAYCRTNACRRVHILGHFDETSRAEDCHRGCDNCANNTPLKTEAVTDVGLAAIRLVKSLTQPPMLINVSGTLLNETLLGGKTQVVNSARSNSHQSYGAARGMRATLNYVLDKLLSINGLAMHRKQNGMGSNDYWVLGSQAQHMLEHNTPVHITYRCSQSTATPQSGTRSSNKKAKARKSDTVPTTSNNCDDMGDPSAIAPFIPADEDYGLNQNGDDALMRSTQSLHISVPSTSHQLAVGPAPTPIASSSRQASRPSNVSSNTQSLRISHKSTLGAWRTKRAIHEDRDDGEIFSEEVLNKLADMPPSSNLEDVRHIFKTSSKDGKYYPADDVVDEKMRKYGRSILRVLAKSSAQV